MLYTVDIAAFLVMMAVLSACSYDHARGPSPRVDCTKIVPDTVFFSRDVLPILTANCSTADCHSGAQPEGNLNLEPAVAYQSLMKKRSGYIDTLHPEMSILYISLVSTNDPMPPNGTLDECSIETILEWIKQKAKNN